MNLVMQFRKVCNHPDLFERADVVSPFMFGTFSQSNLSREQDGMYLPDSAKNAISIDLPRLVWDESIGRISESGKAGGEGWVLRNLCSIWRPDWIRRRLDEGEDGWGFLRIKGTDEGEVCKSATGHPLVQLLEAASEGERKVERGAYER
jgi:DNA helicase INO80